jgi:hypothetical protein
MIVDSSNSAGLYVNGPNTINMPIGVAGNYVNNGATISPTPKTGVAPLPDPLSWVPQPTVGKCDYNNFTNNGGKFTLNPGVYCGGIYINGPATITYNPGLYILKGGGMYLNGDATLIGNGVTFYNTTDTGTSSGNIGQIYLNGNDIIKLSAPTSDVLGKGLSGILFFQNRTVKSAPDAYINGNFGSTITGALYFPNSKLYYNGNGTQNAPYTIIVADTIYFNGDKININIGNDFSSLANGSPIKSSTLYE